MLADGSLQPVAGFRLKYRPTPERWLPRASDRYTIGGSFMSGQWLKGALIHSSLRGTK